MSEQKPSIGRIVHYRLPDYLPNSGAVAPAIIVAVDDDLETVNLQLFNNYHSQATWISDVSQAADDSANPGEWVWPPRV